VVVVQADWMIVCGAAGVGGIRGMATHPRIAGGVVRALSGKYGGSQQIQTSAGLPILTMPSSC
jgi:hypothetical protein